MAGAREHVFSVKAVSPLNQDVPPVLSVFFHFCLPTNHTAAALHGGHCFAIQEKVLAQCPFPILLLVKGSMDCRHGEAGGSA